MVNDGGQCLEERFGERKTLREVRALEGEESFEEGGSFGGEVDATESEAAE